MALGSPRNGLQRGLGSISCQDPLGRQSPHASLERPLRPLGCPQITRHAQEPWTGRGPDKGPTPCAHHYLSTALVAAVPSASLCQNHSDQTILHLPLPLAAPSTARYLARIGALRFQGRP